MDYTNVNGYQIPALTLAPAQTQILGKYGQMRRRFLEQNAPTIYDRMELEGTLYEYLLACDRAMHEQIEQTMQALLKATLLPDRKTDPLGWAQQMNALQAQAEELALPMLFSL